MIFLSTKSSAKLSPGYTTQKALVYNKALPPPAIDSVYSTHFVFSVGLRPVSSVVCWKAEDPVYQIIQFILHEIFVGSLSREQKGGSSILFNGYFSSEIFGFNIIVLS